MSTINAEVDFEVLQQKANEFAMKGALQAIENYYTGYDSPYKKTITGILSENAVDNGCFNLPDIVSLINEHLTQEIDIIANTVVGKTFVPLVAKFLTRKDKEAVFSDILKTFIETAHPDKNPDDFYVSLKKDPSYGWITVSISDVRREYSFTLHENYETRNAQVKKYELLSLPCTEKTERLFMKIETENARLELPFTRDILKDSFVSHLAGYLISRTTITIDETEFNDEMFPDRCHCH